MPRDWVIGIIAIGLMAEFLLGYALFGNPPYSVYSILKVTVAASTWGGAWALYTQSKRLLPLSLGLSLIGGIHLFGKMRRHEWLAFNWCGVVGISLVLIFLIVNLRKSHRQA